MKMFSAILAAVCLFGSITSWACLPPPPGTAAITVQTRILERILNDNVVQTAVKSEGLNVAIRSIDLASGVQIVLTNGCQFEVSRDETNSMPGACPELLPLIVINKVNCR